MKALSEELAETVISLLLKNELLLPEDAEKSKVKLAAGTMKSEDWFLAVEKAMEKKVLK
jgi:hypothetical protein